MLFLLLSLIASPARAEIRIDPQFVVNRILGEGYEAKTIELTAQQAYTAYYTAHAPYDFLLDASAGYKHSKALTLSGGGNLEDKTSVWSVNVSRRLPTGTVFSVGFERTLQNSTFRPTSSALRPNYAVFDVGSITVTQDLLGNFFGIAERQNLRVAEQTLHSEMLLKKERQEQLVLDALSLFWDTFVAKESLREAIAQRNKYEALVKEVQSKTRLGFVNPGDLPKAQAEYGAQVRNVKNSSFNYLTNLDRLVTAMRLDEGDKDFRFEVNEDIPALPEMTMPEIDSLRTVQVNQALLESADYAKRAANLASTWPELRLVLEAGYTGLESTQGKAFASMTSGRNPVYSASLNLNYRFFSDQYRATQNNAEVNSAQAFNNLAFQRDEQRRLIAAAIERVRLTHVAAVSAIEEMKYWEKAVREQERSYRQGRLDFSQLIQDYNSYFRSRSTRIRAIGDYHIALHAYAAAVDQLVR